MRIVRNYLVFSFFMLSSSVYGMEWTDMHETLIDRRVLEIPLVSLQFEQGDRPHTNKELNVTSPDVMVNAKGYPLLEKLKLSYLGDLSKIDLNCMKSLKVLELVGLDVGKIKGFSTLSNLTTLTLDACFSQELSISYVLWTLMSQAFEKKGVPSTPPLQFAFPKWEHLTQLTLTRLKGEVEDLGSLRNLVVLSVLDCPDLQFSLGNLQHLQRLTLKSVYMNNISRPHPLKSLGFLFLEDTANLSESFFTDIGPVKELTLKSVNVKTLRWLNHLPKLARFEVINLEGELTTSQKTLLDNFSFQFNLRNASLEKQFECIMFTHIFTNPSIFGAIWGSLIT